MGHNLTICPVHANRRTRFLDNWWYRVGLQPPCGLERAHRAQALTSPIDSADPDGELKAMCYRYQPGERHNITRLFAAR